MWFTCDHMLITCHESHVDFCCLFQTTSVSHVVLCRLFQATRVSHVVDMSPDVTHT